jgi:hypothetical protein
MGKMPLPGLRNPGSLEAVGRYLAVLKRSNFTKKRIEIRQNIVINNIIDLLIIQTPTYLILILPIVCLAPDSYMYKHILYTYIHTSMYIYIPYIVDFSVTFDRIISDIAIYQG